MTLQKTTNFRQEYVRNAIAQWERVESRVRALLQEGGVESLFLRAFLLTSGAVRRGVLGGHLTASNGTFFMHIPSRAWLEQGRDSDQYAEDAFLVMRTALEILKTLETRRELIPGYWWRTPELEADHHFECGTIRQERSLPYVRFKSYSLHRIEVTGDILRHQDLIDWIHLYRGAYDAKTVDSKVPYRGQHVSGFLPIEVTKTDESLWAYFAAMIADVEVPSDPANVTLPAGRYWIGDLASVFHKKGARAYFDHTAHLKGTDDVGGISRGSELGTYFLGQAVRGPDVYQDAQGRTYNLFSGFLGVIEDKFVPDPERLKGKGGHWIVFEQPFICRIAGYDGEVRIGPLSINTLYPAPTSWVGPT